MIAIKSVFLLFLILHITATWTREQSTNIYNTFDLSKRKTISGYFKLAENLIKVEIKEANKKAEAEKKNKKISQAKNTDKKFNSQFATEWASHTAFLNTPEILKNIQFQYGKENSFDVVFPINNYFDEILNLKNWLKTSCQKSPFKNYCETYFEKIDSIINGSIIYKEKQIKNTQTKTEKAEKNKVILQKRFVHNNPMIESDSLSSKIESKVFLEEDPIILTRKNSVSFNEVDIEDNQTADEEESEPITLKLPTRQAFSFTQEDDNQNEEKIMGPITLPWVEPVSKGYTNTVTRYFAKDVNGNMVEVPETVYSAGHKSTELVDLNESEVASTKNDQNFGELMSLKNKEKQVGALKKVRKIIFVEILACENCKNDETLKKFLGQEN